MTNTLNKSHIETLEAIQRNHLNPHPDAMTLLREQKYVLSHHRGSGYSITVKGLAAIDRAKRQST